ncbi:hypothetical protein CRUP_032199 [Coryphaenoides rupestris]|nr:hypothetical protein CRUP_032199 [Coryphaenoides rupestris]
MAVGTWCSRCLFAALLPPLSLNAFSTRRRDVRRRWWGASVGGRCASSAGARLGGRRLGAGGASTLDLEATGSRFGHGHGLRLGAFSTFFGNSFFTAFLDRGQVTVASPWVFLALQAYTPPSKLPGLRISREQMPCLKICLNLGHWRTAMVVEVVVEVVEAVGGCGGGSGRCGAVEVVEIVEVAEAVEVVEIVEGVAVLEGVVEVVEAVEVVEVVEVWGSGEQSSLVLKPTVAALSVRAVVNLGASVESGSLYSGGL